MDGQMDSSIEGQQYPPAANAPFTNKDLLKLGHG